MATNYLSFYDLNQVIGFKSAKQNNDKEEFERILYENGADIKYPYHIYQCTHRPRTSPIEYTGLLVRFVERTDDKWIKSGAASLAAIVDSSKDPSLREELHSLEPSSSDEWEDRVQYLTEGTLDIFIEGEDLIGNIEIEEGV